MHYFLASLSDIDLAFKGQKLYKQLFVRAAMSFNYEIHIFFRALFIEIYTSIWRSPRASKLFIYMRFSQNQK